MNDKQALRKLIEAVEAGTLPDAVFHGCSAIRGHWAYTTGLTAEQRAWVYMAYHGSLNSAKALHEALLPEDYIVSSDSTGFAHVWRDEFEVTNNWTALIPGNEARARLLAILRAYEAQQ